MVPPGRGEVRAEEPDRTRYHAPCPGAGERAPRRRERRSGRSGDDAVCLTRSPDCGSLLSMAKGIERGKKDNKPKLSTKEKQKKKKEKAAKK
jgi:hypothetical protein